MYVVLLLVSCPYCHSSEELLKKHGIEYESFVFSDTYVEGKKYYDKQVFKNHYGENATFPKIYDHQENFIGGYDDLKKYLINLKK